jgi:hypothetical protein
LLEYVSSDRFQPSATLAPATLDSLFKSVRFRAAAATAAPGHPAEAAVDGDPSTFWHSEWQTAHGRLPASLAIDLGSDAGIRGIRYTPRQDINRGRIRRYRIEFSHDGRTWQPAAPEASFPDTTEPHEILFVKPIVARHIRLTALHDHGGANAAAIAEFEPLPDLSADSRGLGVIPGLNDGE